MAKRRAFLVSLGVFLGLTGVAAQRGSPGSVQGMWRVTEVTTTGPTGQTNSQPQPGFYMFTAKHYMIMTITSDKPRPTIADVAKATADELRATWDPFTANAGSYELSGGMLTTRPLVAKQPQAMASGAFTVRSVRLEGNTLTLTNVRSQTGPTPNPTTLKLTRVE